MATTPAAIDVVARRRIRNRAAAIGLSVIPFGLSFGAVSVAAGLSVLQTCLLSLVLFSGASQFALVSIAGGGGGLAGAVGTALLLGARNGVYATRITELVRPHGVRRLVAAHTTIDETTAMALAEARNGYAASAFWTTAAVVYLCWNVSTAAGALAGSGLGSPAAAGLDAAGPAAFVALIGPRLDTGRMRSVTAVSAAASLLAVPLLPVGVPVLAGGAAAVLLLGVRR